MLVANRANYKQSPVRGGFTLLEMLVVVAIIVVLAGVGGFILLPQLQVAKEKVDYTTTKEIAKACDTYKLLHGDYPQNLQQLTERVGSDPPIFDAGHLEPKSVPGGQFGYDPSGPNNQGLTVDVWVDAPSGRIGNWTKR
jgi:prepilin-type N-terminal cleavage/methylation domain-containing protein